VPQLPRGPHALFSHARAASPVGPFVHSKELRHGLVVMHSQNPRNFSIRASGISGNDRTVDGTDRDASNQLGINANLSSASLDSGLIGAERAAACSISAMHSKGRSFPPLSHVADPNIHSVFSSVVTYLRIDNLTTASSWHLSSVIGSCPTPTVTPGARYRIALSFADRANYCRLVDIARHFQTGQQFDTACEAARRRGQACALVSDDKLRLARPELLKRSGFVLLAAVVDR